MKTAQKRPVSPTYWLKKCQNAILNYNYLTKYTPKTFFEEYINFTNFCYLRRCGVIPGQSFGSHIRPQLPGLGLKANFKGKKEMYILFNSLKLENFILSFSSQNVSSLENIIYASFLDQS